MLHDINEYYQRAWTGIQYRFHRTVFTKYSLHENYRCRPMSWKQMSIEDSTCTPAHCWWTQTQTLSTEKICSAHPNVSEQNSSNTATQSQHRFNTSNVYFAFVRIHSPRTNKIKFIFNTKNVSPLYKYVLYKYVLYNTYIIIFYLHRLTASE